ncbi:MAG: ergothioneine biosynthesis protein EgtC [Okeania sp. SIO2F4]|uniref:ergothioneine biosynthesis protein EgtC n=1 Tax=Okeania sp. SIO2F4 TaxID=2607790 RepID=UPI00142C27B6|nr:ergothioneine biosynthesis protein EgtC [Okeania sp. SIO2F4]NES02953.1 ergothioneine biosynthesis protein EgtC [Okeania sp. SIO2F4]
MCRLLAYLGSPIQPDQLIYEPEHSLCIQSYRPQETTTTSVNADGVGIGWYHSQKQTEPFIYKNILPIWSDINLPYLSRYIETECFLAYIRSATPGQASNLNNCQPFYDGRLLFLHNGFIDDFRQSLFQPIRKSLKDDIYLKIQGTTDSEHIFALFLNELASIGSSLEDALEATLQKLNYLAKPDDIRFAANIIVSDGCQLVASRFSRGIAAPSLYWLQDDPILPSSVAIASEPLFAANWNRVPDSSIICSDQQCTGVSSLKA